MLNATDASATRHLDSLLGDFPLLNSAECETAAPRQPINTSAITQAHMSLLRNHRRSLSATCGGWTRDTRYSPRFGLVIYSFLLHLTPASVTRSQMLELDRSQLSAGEEGSTLDESPHCRANTESCNVEAVEVTPTHNQRSKVWLVNFMTPKK